MIGLLSGCNYLSRMEMGKRALNRKDYASGVNSFSMVLQKETDSAEGYFFRGYAFYKQQLYDNARRDFESSIKLKPSSSAHCGLALVFLEQNEKALAEHHFSAAIALAPDLP